MMTFNGITPLWQEMPLQQSKLVVQQETPALSFKDIFRSAIQEVSDAQNEVAQADYLLATGQLDNPAYATIAIAKAELSVSMLAQLRTKALDAYNELMRISM
ncbi:MAG: flagellar hook-basal body complex protein FliE [Firmicutes bacterium]|nr:flagellar hook-basal body complex protein FliE [Bacillota bacterium]